MAESKSLSEKVDDVRERIESLTQQKTEIQEQPYHPSTLFYIEKQIIEAERELDKLNYQKDIKWHDKWHKEKHDLLNAEKQELQDKLDDRAAQREHELLKQRMAQEHSDKANDKKARVAKSDAMQLAAYKANLTAPHPDQLKAQADNDLARLNVEIEGAIRKNHKQFEADMYKIKAELTASKELKQLDHLNLKDLKEHEAGLEAQLHQVKTKVDTAASNEITTHQTNERLREAEVLLGFKQSDREHELTIEMKKQLFLHILGKDRDTHQANLKRPSTQDESEILQSVDRLLASPKKYHI